MCGRGPYPGHRTAIFAYRCSAHTEFVRRALDAVHVGGQAAGFGGVRCTMPRVFQGAGRCMRVQGGGRGGRRVLGGGHLGGRPVATGRPVALFMRRAQCGSARQASRCSALRAAGRRGEAARAHARPCLLPALFGVARAECGVGRCVSLRRLATICRRPRTAPSGIRARAVAPAKHTKCRISCLGCCALD